MPFFLCTADYLFRFEVITVQVSKLERNQNTNSSQHTWHCFLRLLAVHSSWLHFYQHMWSQDHRQCGGTDAACQNHNCRQYQIAIYGLLSSSLLVPNNPSFLNAYPTEQNFSPCEEKLSKIQIHQQFPLVSLQCTQDQLWLFCSVLRHITCMQLVRPVGIQRQSTRLKQCSLQALARPILDLFGNTWGIGGSLTLPWLLLLFLPGRLPSFGTILLQNKSKTAIYLISWFKNCKAIIRFNSCGKFCVVGAPDLKYGLGLFTFLIRLVCSLCENFWTTFFYSTCVVHF
jgi:hypothetical protein